MGALLVATVGAAFLLLLALGCRRLIKDYRKRLDEWAQAQGATILRCEETGDLHMKRRPRWRIRVRTAEGEIRDGWAQGGMSASEPVEVAWADPGESVFR